MKNIQIEVTHSLSFLTNTIQDINEIQKTTKDTVDELYSMDLDKDGAPGQMRKKSSDYRDDADEIIEIIINDYKLFQEDMTDIIQNKHSETVIYSLRRFRELSIKYDDIQKDFDKLYKKIEYYKNKCESNKDYVKLIALNKVSVPIFRINEILKHIVSKVETLTKK